MMIYDVNVAYDGVSEVTSKSIQSDYISNVFTSDVFLDILSVDCLSNGTLSAMVRGDESARTVACIMKNVVLSHGGVLI